VHDKLSTRPSDALIPMPNGEHARCAYRRLDRMCGAVEFLTKYMGFCKRVLSQVHGCVPCTVPVHEMKLLAKVNYNIKTPILNFFTL